MRLHSIVILSSPSSPDPTHVAALRTYFTKFEFGGLPLDVALRKLLMEVSLPKETQQIDRVIEAFALRYDACEPDIFAGKDQTYVLAFSMIMLHTDAFNKHNKHKMTRAEYVRNTRLDGVQPVVLEVSVALRLATASDWQTFYDNVTYTAFVYVQDDSEPERPSSRDFMLMTPASVKGTKQKPKLDIYDIISRDELYTFRVDEKPTETTTPFFCGGTQSVMDLQRVQSMIVAPSELRMRTPGSRKGSVSGASGSGTETIRVIKAGPILREGT